MSKEEKVTNEYNEDSIQVLEGLEAVRKRPGMYIGTVSVRGLHHLIYEIVDNSVDEALAGYCREINVTLNSDNSVNVVDNGRGVPIGIHHKMGIPTVEVVYTILHAGGKFNKGSYKVSGGLHGVGVSCVNALSTSLVAVVKREGKIFRQSYSCGKAVDKLTVIGETEETGTSITFKPDGSIFQETVYDFDILANRLRELAFLNRGIKLSLTDEREYVDDDGKIVIVPELKTKKPSYILSSQYPGQKIFGNKFSISYFRATSQ